MEIGIEDALKRTDLLFIDLRSPKEFAGASIPGAVNVPLFDDREHHQLGIIYHQLGEIEARRVALEIVAPKLPAMVRKIQNHCGNLKPLLYCRRGGLRSISFYQIMNLAAVEVYRLKKGYKAYRSYINERLKTYHLPNKLIVLHGLTGVGKTTILHELKAEGLPVIDLEGLARHKGSVFGSVGISKPSSQKDFDSLLIQQLDRLASQPYLFVEGEGKRIGNVYLPAFLTKGMEDGYQVLLQADLETRVQRILADYTIEAMSDNFIEQIRSALESLRNRLGDNKVDQLHLLLNQENYSAVACLLCTDYYDHYYTDSRTEYSRFDQIIDVNNLDRAVKKLTALYEELNSALPSATGPNR